MLLVDGDQCRHDISGGAMTAEVASDSIIGDGSRGSGCDVSHIRYLP